MDNIKLIHKYFESELEDLRTRGAEFSEDYPGIAKELALSKGVSRDPHIEHLLQAVAWMMGSLRLRVDQESSKVPSILLDHLCPNLVSSIPSMAIVECEVDGNGANFTRGYTLPENVNLSPIHLDANDPRVADLEKCRFTTCFPQPLWPLEVTSVARSVAVNHANVVTARYKYRSSINIQVSEVCPGASAGMTVNTSLRFYINLEQPSSFKIYDLIARNVIGVLVKDSSDNVIKYLGPESLSVCGFSDDERLLPGITTQELGFSLLTDYYALPSKFLFFEIKNIANIKFESLVVGDKGTLTFGVMFNEDLPSGVSFSKHSIKLNCLPIVNLFSKSSEPIPVNGRNYRYPVVASRIYPDLYEIYKVKKLVLVNSKGEQEELAPLFPAGQKDIDRQSGTWVIHKEDSFKRNKAGSDFWVTVQSKSSVLSAGNSSTIHAQTICSNLTTCERLNSGQKLAIIGSAPVLSACLVGNPSSYVKPNSSSSHLWTLLSYLSLSHQSLSDPETAKAVIVSILTMHARNGDLAALHQIGSIESITASPDQAVVKNAGWKGYYSGVKYTVAITDKKFDGSLMLFGAVLSNMLALFCNVNSFSSLEISIGNKVFHKWPPKTGQKIVA